MVARTPKKLRAADLFCGAGGSSTGAVNSGHVEVVYALNHWPTAIASHSANHPDTQHVCERIDAIDPRRQVPEIDLLMASPECTHHSNARGGRPMEDQKRATGWHVVHWAEVKQPKWIIVENVREFLSWGPLGRDGRPVKANKGSTFRAWLACLTSLGYHCEWKLLNAADYGAATKRIRFFMVARRGTSRKPIPWPEPSHVGNWRPAHEIIDWQRPCPSIFDRKRPLSPKTLKRIEIGLRKFCGEGAEPFIVQTRGPGYTSSQDRIYPTSEPMPTIIGHNHRGVVQPFVLHSGGRNNGDAASPDEPLTTVVARNHHAVIQPFLVPHFGERPGQMPRTHPVTDPLPAVTGQGAGSLVQPFLFDTTGRGAGRSKSLDEPLPSIVAARNGKSIVMPFITQFNGTGGANSVQQPLTTVTAKHRHGLALVELMDSLGIVDIGFRMLDVDELAAAQSFPAGYVLTGNKADQVRQVGNAVPPVVMQALCTAIAAA
jgi:DNA (cytosine-5)-methyltransferase 1